MEREDDIQTILIVFDVVTTHKYNQLLILLCTTPVLNNHCIVKYHNLSLPVVFHNFRSVMKTTTKKQKNETIVFKNDRFLKEIVLKNGRFKKKRF